MSIAEKIDINLKEAMKLSDKIRVSILRIIKASLKNLEIEKRTELTDEDIIGVLSSLAKKGRESISEFEKAGRKDLVDRERQELLIIQTYLPEQLSSEELTSLISETIEQTGASAVKDMGVIMKQLMPKVKGRADGRVVNEKVRELLEERESGNR
jgi:uncharacterized protein YqeY